MDPGWAALGGAIISGAVGLLVLVVRGRQESRARHAERWLADRRDIYARFLAQSRELRDEINRRHSLGSSDVWMENYPKDLVLLGTELLEELGLVAPKSIYSVARNHLDALATVSVRKAWLKGSMPPLGEEATPRQAEMMAKHSADIKKYTKMADETREQLLEMMRADLGVDLDEIAR